MDLREQDGRVVLTYDGTPLTRGLFAIGGLFALTAVYDLTWGGRGTERLVALSGAVATCVGIGIVFLETARFEFDAARSTIVWRRRWGFSRRSGTTAFADVRRVVVEVPLGDEGTPSRRICLRLADGSTLPLTAGYRVDPDDAMVAAAERLRALLGLRAATSADDRARELVEDGSTMAAVKMLLEREGLTLAEAKRRVDDIKSRLAAPRDS